MRFLGIDLGWVSQPSGLASLSWDGRRLSLSSLDRLATLPEVLSWVNLQTTNTPAWIALDAPVLIPNPSGMRPVDRDMHRLFGRQKAGCYPVHSQMPFAPRLLSFAQSLREQGFSTTPPTAPLTPTRHLFEVYPHAASIRLFNLPQILPYKKGPIAQRRAALAEFRHLLSTQLATRQPALKLPSLPEIPATGPALKAVEDQLDAILCAYIAAHSWFWGYSRTNLIGHPEEGFLLNPSF